MFGETLDRMTHDYQVEVLAQDADRVVFRFALRFRRRRSITNGVVTYAEHLTSRSEGQKRTGRRLNEVKHRPAIVQEGLKKPGSLPMRGDRANHVGELAELTYITAIVLLGQDDVEYPSVTVEMGEALSFAGGGGSAGVGLCRVHGLLPGLGSRRNTPDVVQYRCATASVFRVQEK